MKIVKLPAADPQKRGSRKVNRKKEEQSGDQRQLNLFSTGKILRLHPMTTFEEAFMLDEQGENEAAKKLYLKAIRAGDPPADAWCNLGILESQEGNYPKAIDYLSQCLAHNPRHLEAHYNLANLYAEAGNLPLAKLHYEISVEIDPTFSNGWFNLGLTLAMEKNYGEAIGVLNRYRKLAAPEEQHSVDELMQRLQRMEEGDGRRSPLKKVSRS